MSQLFCQAQKTVERNFVAIRLTSGVDAETRLDEIWIRDGLRSQEARRILENVPLLLVKGIEGYQRI